MNQQELTWMFDQLVKYGLGGLVAGGIVFMLCRNHLGSYLNKTGENLATKEDIAELTTLVKSVEHGYNVMIEQVKAKQQMRMAAVDKRLEAHQQAFTLWHKLMEEDKEGEDPAVLQCQKFWNENCLYLEPDVRQAFLNAFHHEQIRMGLLQIRAPGSEIEAAWRQVTAFPEVLFKAVQLPGFNAVEREEIVQLAVSKVNPLD